MRDQINALKEQRAKLIEDQRALVLTAETDGRDLTGEENEQFSKREQDIDALEQRAGRMEKLAGLETTPKRQITDDRSGWAGGDDADEETEKVAESLREYNEQRAVANGKRPQDTPEYRAAFFKWLTSEDERGLTPDEVRTMSKASAGAGLNLVPTNFQRELIASLRDYGVMRQIARVITTDSGSALEWPGVSAHGTSSWTAENATTTFSDETLNKTTLNAYMNRTGVKVSWELLQDSAFDLEAYFRTEFGLRCGVLENTGYVVGDGSGKPTGVTTQASAGKVAAGAAAITGDELIDLFYSLAPPYRRNAVWVLNDSTIKLVRKLKDSNGQYLWQQSLQAGAPDVLLGKPVYADPDMPAATTGLVSALFGDFSFYVIRDVNGIAFQRLNELYSENGQVGFVGYHRTDGKLMNTAAVKKLTQA